MPVKNSLQRRSQSVTAVIGIVFVVIILVMTSACSAAAATPSSNPAGNSVNVVAAENFWGSIATQVGGSHVSVTSIIANPNADPHEYEPTSQDARTIADAQYVIYNGVGYDPWMDNLLAANPVKGRTVLNIGDFFGRKLGDNPHLWYKPDYVTGIAGKIRDDLKTIDPANTTEFEQSAQHYLAVGLQQYLGLISDIKSKYSGTPIGATESIFAYMAPALGLNLVTPVSYMKSVSEGVEVSAADEAAVEQQIKQKQIKILIYNSQNTPPNIQIILDLAKAKGIPTPTITETLVPATATFQDWQSSQLQRIEEALKQGTGK